MNLLELFGADFTNVSCMTLLMLLFISRNAMPYEKKLCTFEIYS